MSDFFDNLLTSLKERFSRPLSSSYIIAFALVNYKPLMILFLSDMAVRKRFLLADEYFDNWVYAFFLPLFLTVIYVLLFPFFEDWAKKIWMIPVGNSKLKTLDLELKEAELRRNIEDQKALAGLVEVRVNLQHEIDGYLSKLSVHQIASNEGTDSIRKAAGESSSIVSNGIVKLEALVALLNAEPFKSERDTRTNERIEGVDNVLEYLRKMEKEINTKIKAFNSLPKPQLPKKLDLVKYANGVK